MRPVPHHGLQHPLMMQLISHESYRRQRRRLRPRCEPTSSWPQHHNQTVLFERTTDDTPEDNVVQADDGIVTHPAVGMSENLGILPGGYFAKLLAKRSS